MLRTQNPLLHFQRSSEMRLGLRKVTLKEGNISGATHGFESCGILGSPHLALQVQCPLQMRPGLWKQTEIKVGLPYCLPNRRFHLRLSVEPACDPGRCTV